jgi:hypothetical protein
VDVDEENFVNEKSDVMLLLDDFLRCQLDPNGIDLDWLQTVKADAEHAIEAFRTDPDFASALPAFSLWAELMWQRES